MSLCAEVGLRLGLLDLDVKLRLAAGEVVALLGPNGAGKSTVLRALAGLQPIDRGRIAIDDAVVDDPLASMFVPPEHRHVGMVFQDYVLFEHMSVLENVAFGLRARGMAKSLARQVAAEWIERVGLDGRGAGRPGALSGGQRQRVALARALAGEPRLLLLDEPTAALDAGSRAAVRRELRSHLATFGGMRVIVTHDPVDAHALADRVVVIEHGEVVQTGTLDEVAARPRSRYVADLVGVNFVTGVVSGGVLVTAGGASVVIADAASGPSVAIIRPHSVVLQRESPSGTSQRNTWPGRVIDVDRLGDRCRVALDGVVPLTAEITAAALAALDLRVGDAVHAAVKATDIQVEAS